MSVRGHEATQRWFQAPDRERNWKTLRWKCFLSNCGNKTWPSKRAYSGLQLSFSRICSDFTAAVTWRFKGTQEIFMYNFSKNRSRNSLKWACCISSEIYVVVLFFFLGVSHSSSAYTTWETSCTYRYTTSIQISSHTHYWPRVKGASLDSGRHTEVVQQGDGRGKKNQRTTA